MMPYRLLAWFNAWLDVFRPVSSNEDTYTTRKIAVLISGNRELYLELSRVQAEKRAMRDSIVEHMRREQELRYEIYSLKRHLSMAIDERDQARKRKRRRTS